MTQITLSSAAYPPDLDGIGDYTWWLSSALAKETGKEIRVITRKGDHLEQAGVTVDEAFDGENLDSVKELPMRLEDGWLVFQYNPFSWGRRGWCPAVPEALRKLKEVHPKVRLAVMFHETTVPRWPWRFAIMRRWQRPIFRKMCGLADVAFASSERYVRQIEKIGYPRPVIHLPVGSNLARSELTRDAAWRELRLPEDTVLVGVFGSAHESRLLDWIGVAFAKVKERFANAKVLYVGPHGETITTAVGSRDSVIDLGVQSAARAGLCLSAMDMLLAPFSDGISTRRGSAIAAFQNGVPVATTTTKWTDSVFREKAPEALLLSGGESAEAFATDTVEWASFLTEAGKRESYREEMRKFHDEVFSWSLIARRLLEGLR